MKNKVNRQFLLVIGAVTILAIFVFVLFYVMDKDDVSLNTYTTNSSVAQEIISTSTIDSDDPKITAIKQLLPRFEDYPAKIYNIPPKPHLVHQSNPYGMRFWTLLESWTNEATQYDMAGHYLMGRYGTQNVRVLIIDGLTGKVFHELGSMYPYSVVSSSLVVFDPIDPKCFNANGDYTPCYDNENPRYAVWDGEKFETICEAEIKNWKLVSCGEVSDKKSEIFRRRMIVWTGTVVAKNSGSLQIKDTDIELKQYGYSQFIAESDKEDILKDLDKVKIGDNVNAWGYWIDIKNGMPRISITGILVNE